MQVIILCISSCITSTVCRNNNVFIITSIQETVTNTMYAEKMSQSGIEQLMPVLTLSVPSLVRTKTYAQPLSNTGEVNQPNVDEYHI